MTKANRFPKTALLLMACFIVIAAIGILLAVNSCATSEVKSPVEDIYSDNDDTSNSGNPSLSYPSHYENLESVKLPYNLPHQLKDYTGFTVSFNKDNHTPNYVAWELLGTEISNQVDRTDNFWEDIELEGCPNTRDYTGSGYDRGHLCPAADQKWSLQAMNDCFVMANMCPQDHQLNAGAWNTLENKERQWAKRDSAIVIVAGPIYTEEDTKRIGNIGVRVPGAFFKAIIAPYSKNPKGIAFVYPNMSAPGNMSYYAMSIDDLEAMIDFDLFHNLPDEIEGKIESEYSFTEWNSN